VNGSQTVGTYPLPVLAQLNSYRFYRRQTYRAISRVNTRNAGLAPDLISFEAICLCVPGYTNPKIGSLCLFLCAPQYELEPLMSGLPCKVDNTCQSQSTKRVPVHVPESVSTKRVPVHVSESVNKACTGARVRVSRRSVYRCTCQSQSTKRVPVHVPGSVNKACTGARARVSQQSVYRCTCQSQSTNRVPVRVRPWHEVLSLPARLPHAEAVAGAAARGGEPVAELHHGVRRPRLALNPKPHTLNPKP